MQSNRLQLNTSKTDLLWCVTTRCHHLLYRGPHLKSALTPSLRRRLCEASASLLTPISACGRTSNGLSPAASLFCGNFVASDDQFHLCFRCSSFHWLRAPEAERIKFRLAVIVYRAVHGTAPRYLSDLLHRVSDITSRRRLRSSTSSELVIPLSRLVTVSNRSFAVAAAPGSETLCLRTLHLRRLYWCSDEN